MKKIVLEKPEQEFLKPEEVQYSHIVAYISAGDEIRLLQRVAKQVSHMSDPETTPEDTTEYFYCFKSIFDHNNIHESYLSPLKEESIKQSLEMGKELYQFDNVVDFFNFCLNHHKSCNG